MWELLRKTPLMLDGAMGTMLQRSGLDPGKYPETLCVTNGGAVESIHRQYIESGSDIIYTCTFGANRRKLAGSGYKSADIVRSAVRLARGAAEGSNTKVALSVGPIGELLRPAGALPFEEAYDIFREMIATGAEAGADLIVLETMADLLEVKAGVLAAKENTSLPVFVSMTYEITGRTFLGCGIESMACALEGMGIDAIGINCSLGPADIFPLAKRLILNTGLPVFIKANAGLPDPATGGYDVSAEEFGKQMARYAEIGVGIMGGCCGTTPDYIREIIRNVRKVAQQEKRRTMSAVCTPSRLVEIGGGVAVIGENLNPTGKKDVQRALSECDMSYVANLAVRQADAGADILDINVGMPGADEAALMKKAVEAVQGATDLPLQIDSADPGAIEAALRAVSGKAIVNSVRGTDESIRSVLPLIRKYGAAVVGLTLDEKGLPATAEERFAIAERILDAALELGIGRENVFIDCLTLTVSAQQRQAAETLKAVRMVKEKLGLNTVLGISNISFGLPDRELIARTFLVESLASGLSLPIINPLVKGNMDAIAAFRALSGEDKGCDAYISRFSARKDEKPASMPAADFKMTLGEAVIKGLAGDAAEIAEELLRGKEAGTIIDEILIPALDKVGEDFQSGGIFLPQLISSANASCAVFEAIKKNIGESGGVPVKKGKIILATVLGDVHDIGKNIAGVVLENYGYEVIDLGRDVPAGVIAEKALAENVRLIGLSALMTTTLENMKDTIRAIRETGHDCKIMAGGAVLTRDYAEAIGADYYAKDAKAGADIAKTVLG